MPITDIRPDILKIATDLGIEKEPAEKLAQKCYDDIVWRPYGGATSFQEVDDQKNAQMYAMKVEDTSYAMRGIVDNIVANDDMSPDEKSEAITKAATDFKDRVNALSMTSGDKEDGTIIDKIKGVFGQKTIKKENGKWVLYSKDGSKKLGTFDSEEAAKKRERQVSAFKNKEITVSDGFKIFTDEYGNIRWASVSSNAFEDKTGELFTTKALDEAIEYADKSDERGPLLVYHVPSAEIGRCDFQAMAGRFLIESGTFDDTPLGNKALEYFINTDEDFQVSIGFKYIEGDEKDGQYDWLRIRERSICPDGKAANPWTSFSIAGENAMNDAKKEMMFKVFGNDLAEKVIAEAETKTKELEESVRFKTTTEEEEVDDSFTPEDIKQLSEAVKAIPNEAVRAKFQKKLVAMNGGKEVEEETPETTTETPVAIGGEQLANLAGLMANIAETVESLVVDVKELKERGIQKEQSKDEDGDVQHPRWQFNRPSESKETVLSQKDVDDLGFKNEDQWVNPAQKYVDDLLKAGSGARE